MNEHITSNEFRQYFDILLSGTLNEDDADFMNDIDAHIAECDQCLERMQAIRLLMQGFSSSPDLARSFINTEFPETLTRPAFDIKKIFIGVRLKIEKKVAEFEKRKTQVFADIVSDKMNATFVPQRSMLAAARGNGEIGIDGSAINDLLCSDMVFSLEGGRKITLRCENMLFTDGIRLFIYSNFEVNFKLTFNGNIYFPVKKDHDIATNEYVLVYALDGDDEFLLTAE